MRHYGIHRLLRLPSSVTDFRFTPRGCRDGRRGPGDASARLGHTTTPPIHGRRVKRGPSGLGASRCITSASWPSALPDLRGDLAPWLRPGRALTTPSTSKTRGVAGAEMAKTPSPAAANRVGHGRAARAARRRRPLTSRVWTAVAIGCDESANAAARRTSAPRRIRPARRVCSPGARRDVAGFLTTRRAAPLAQGVFDRQDGVEKQSATRPRADVCFDPFPSCALPARRRPGPRDEWNAHIAPHRGRWIMAPLSP